MKRVLLVNRGTCNNLGDQAINIAFSQFLHEKLKCDVKFEDYTSKSQSVSKITGTLQKNKLRNLLKNILPLNLIWFLRNYSRIGKCIVKNNPDLIVIGGGQLLLPGRFSIAAYTWVYLAKKYKIKIVFSNIGYGGKLSWLESLFISWAVNHADGVNVRDIDSAKKILEDFNVMPIVSADIVFTNYKVRLAEFETKNKIAVGITDLSVFNIYNPPLTREHYYRLWIDFLGGNNISLNEIVLMYTTQEDSSECISFKNHVMEEFGLDLKILSNSTLDEYVENLKEVRFVISGRMHGLIIALNNGCKVLTFPISNKLISFDAIISNENLSFIKNKSEKVTEEFIYNFLNQK